MNAKKIQEQSIIMENLLKEERDIQERERYNTISEMYNMFVESKPTIKDKTYLNKHLLIVAIKSYYDDIYRFKLYSHSERADNHKQSAYIIKWLSKIRPIQILPDIEISDDVLLVNASFAIFVGFCFINCNIADIISPHYLKHLLYMAQYRNISGKQLASLIYLIEKMAKKEKP